MTTKKKHWATDEAARDRLKAFGSKHGLGSPAILEILGVEKIDEYKGTEVEAVAVIAKWAKENEPPDPQAGDELSYEPIYEAPMLNVSDKDQQAYFEACAQLPETPIIAWTVFQDAKGAEWSYTIHAGLPADQAAIARQLTMVEIAAFHEDAARYGWTPLIDQRRIPNGGGVQKPIPALQLVPQSKNGGTQAFSPQTLEYAGKSEKGSLYWKCKGHPFNQYGVTIWEESLPPELKEKAITDLSQDLDLTGWVATYSLQPSRNDPDKLVPDKVVSLTKAA
jgi:hypothetical protein